MVKILVSGSNTPQFRVSLVVNEQRIRPSQWFRLLLHVSLMSPSQWLRLLLRVLFGVG